MTTLLACVDEKVIHNNFWPFGNWWQRKQWVSLWACMWAAHGAGDLPVTNNEL